MPDEKKLDRFKSQQPAIPGVPADKVPPKPVPPEHLSPEPAKVLPRSPFLWVGLAAGAVVIIGAGIAWWAHTSSAKQVPSPVVEAPADPTPEPVAKPVEQLPMVPGEIATTEEMSKVWSSKRFIFRDPVTSQQTLAIAVRLPGGTLWGVSLREPYGTCDSTTSPTLKRCARNISFAPNTP